MKKIFLFALVLLSTFANAQLPNWVWGKSAGSNYPESTNALDVDNAGNVYITGAYSGPSITFGSQTISHVTDSISVFVVKYDPSGNVIWAKSAEGQCRANDISVDAAGNVFVTGSYKDTVSFGNFSINGSQGEDVFLVKYDANGNEQWLRHAGGTDDDIAFGVAVDGAGNAYITGHFFSPAGITFGSSTLLHPGPNTAGFIFLVRYDAAGNVIWANSYGNVNGQLGWNVTVDDSSNLFVTGTFQSGTLSFGAVSVNHSIGSNDDVFIAKFDSLGNGLWVKAAGGAQYDLSYGIATDPHGDVFISGEFFSSTIFFDSIAIFNNGFVDLFIAKFSGIDGHLLWVKTAGGSSFDASFWLTTDYEGNVYLTGVTASSFVDFNNNLAISTGGAEIIIAKYDGLTGLDLWAMAAGTPGDEWGATIGADPAGNLYVSGGFGPNDMTLGPSLLNNVDSTDIYLGRLESTVGIKNIIPQEQKLILFPNPVHNRFQFETILEKPRAIALIEIFNMTGSKVLSDKIKSDEKGTIKKSIDVDFPPGLYLLRVMDGKTVYEKKIIVQ